MSDIFDNCMISLDEQATAFRLKNFFVHKFDFQNLDRYRLREYLKIHAVSSFLNANTVGIFIYCQLK